MARPLDVCIRGGGIVGYALAMLLARERLQVGLVDTRAERSGAHADVRAYALNAHSRALLQDLRCWPGAAHATPVLSMHVRDAGAGAVQFHAARYDVAALAWIVDVAVLESQLAEAASYQPQIAVSQDEAEAPLTVICEGHASASRAQLGVERDVTRYAQWAIACRVRCETAHAQAARQWFTPDDVLAFLPLEGPDGNAMAVVWSVGEERKAELLQASPEAFAEQLAQACGHQFGRLELLGERAAWPLHLAVARQWCGIAQGRTWALAGDAAHTVHPLAGQGLNLGLADAQELASRIHGRESWRTPGDLKLLRGYERARKADVAVMGAATDALQQVFARPGPRWERMRHWGMAGFDGSGPLKRWVAQRAMGLARAKRLDTHLPE